MQFHMLIKADKFDEDEKKKFPKRVKQLPEQELLNFDEKKLYIIRIQRTEKTSTYIYLTIAILLVLFVCMFPIWPLSVKLGVWWLLVGILVFMVLN